MYQHISLVFYLYAYIFRYAITHHSAESAVNGKPVVQKALSKDCDIETMSTGTLLAQHHQAKHLVGESVFRKPDVLKKKMSCFRNHRLNLLAALDFVSPSLPVRFIEVLRCLPRGFFSRPRCLPTPCGQAPSGLPHSRSEHCQGSHGWKIGR